MHIVVLLHYQKFAGFIQIVAQLQ